MPASEEAVFREKLKTLRRWGRWGDNDQAGALNLVTADKVLRAVSLVRLGRVISMSRDFPIAPALNNPNPAEHYLRKRTRGSHGEGSVTDYVGINFHGSFSGGNYEAVSGGNGSYVAHPLYYAMLLFHNAAQGQTIPVSVATHSNVMVHAALGPDGTLRVVAINNEAATNVQVRITPGRTFRSAGTLRLAGPSLDATSGVTYAGASVGSDGSWVPGTYAPVYTTGSVYAVSVPASSIAVVTLVP